MYTFVDSKNLFFLIAFLFLYWKDITILLSVFNLILSYIQKFYHKILNLNKYDNLYCTVGSEIPTVQYKYLLYNINTYCTIIPKSTLKKSSKNKNQVFVILKFQCLLVQFKIKIFTKSNNSFLYTFQLLANFIPPPKRKEHEVVFEAHGVLVLVLLS